MQHVGCRFFTPSTDKFRDRREARKWYYVTVIFLQISGTEENAPM
jgi:hypothetical protein